MPFPELPLLVQLLLTSIILFIFNKTLPLRMMGISTVSRNITVR